MKKSKNIKILFLDILTGNRQLRKEIEKEVYGGGTYSEAMRKAFGLQKNQWVTIDASKGKFPNPIKYDAVVIGGSFEDPVKGKEKQWMKKTYRYIRELVETHVPILGICGGLEFVVRALGGEIIFNPKGREFGSVKVSLTKIGKRDPLFKNVPKNLLVQISHKCMAEKLLPGWKLLATSRLCKIQAIAVGNTIRLIQFHPELTRKHLRALARLRKNALIKEGFVKNNADFDKFLSSIKNLESTGKRILKNFICYFVLPRKNDTPGVSR